MQGGGGGRRELCHHGPGQARKRADRNSMETQLLFPGTPDFRKMT